MSIAHERMNEIVSEVIKSIERNDTGIFPKSWVGGGLPKNYSSQTPYRGLNTLTLMMVQEQREFSSNLWLTFNQIKKIKGARLLKGSTGTPVFFFNIIEKEKEREGEVTLEKIPFLKFYYVFNLDQIEGIDIGTPKEENVSLHDFVANTGVVVKKSYDAYYIPDLDYIGIPDLKLFDSAESYASVLLHELAHSTGHPSRLNRDLSGEFGSDAYAKEECIAELSSMFLCAHLQIDNEPKKGASYIKGWLINGLKEEPKFLWKIASESQKVLNYLVALQEHENAA